MFERFLARQQALLDELGQQKNHSRQQLEQHRQRFEILCEFDQSLGQVQSHSALFHQNRLALRGQLGELLASQRQEMELAQLDLNYQQQMLLRQFGKVKGLEGVQQKKDKEVLRQNERREQQQLDEWISARGRSQRGPGR
ncbi:flagellar FliJ family protein [Gallaecimonas pentaromativorans]|uniref:flagellar FliJ family protein n=1 Tax=Gallaecimonas pentaromativorans TaxID=584787 RepID=UPI00067F1A88|nr:flagellar FliJ family protein [Gallaecimonas pentaromativorans]MED5526529.1 flagellar FliJ family protein [Pseudomonadota bacterium]